MEAIKVYLLCIKRGVKSGEFNPIAWNPDMRRLCFGRYAECLKEGLRPYIAPERRDYHAYRHACIKGYTDVVEWLPVSGTIPFVAVCAAGHYEMAQWLYLQGVPTKRQKQGFEIACKMGHLDIIEWLYPIMDNKVRLRGFGKTCETGQLKAAKWMYGTFHHVSKNEGLTRLVVKSGNTSMLKWLFEIGVGLAGNTTWYSCKNVEIAKIILDKMSDEPNYFKMFHMSCICGRLELAKWIVSLSNVSPMENTFPQACRGGHLNTVKWLYDTGLYYDSTDFSGQFVDALIRNDIEMAQFFYYDVLALEECPLGTKDWVDFVYDNKRRKLR